MERDKIRELILQGFLDKHGIICKSKISPSEIIYVETEDCGVMINTTKNRHDAKAGSNFISQYSISLILYQIRPTQSPFYPKEYLNCYSIYIENQIGGIFSVRFDKVVDNKSMNYKISMVIQKNIEYLIDIVVDFLYSGNIDYIFEG